MTEEQRLSERGPRSLYVHRGTGSGGGHGWTDAHWAKKPKFFTIDTTDRSATLNIIVIEHLAPQLFSFRCKYSNVNKY